MPLDIFRKILHNKGIRNQLEAWLTFLSSDEPEIIEKLILAYPSFQAYYQEIYELCRDTERMMEMFSKELRELDQNTVQYMIDQMQEEIDRQKELLDEKQDTIEQQQGKLDAQQDTIALQQGKLEEKEAALLAAQEENRRLKELLENRTEA